MSFKEEPAATGNAIASAELIISGGEHGKHARISVKMGGLDFHIPYENKQMFRDVVLKLYSVPGFQADRLAELLRHPIGGHHSLIGAP